MNDIVFTLNGAPVNMTELWNSCRNDRVCIRILCTKYGADEDLARLMIEDFKAQARFREAIINNNPVKQNGSSIKTITLRCKTCNGIMQAYSNKQQLVCPYCDSRELIVDSDAVAIEKVRNNTYKELEYARMRYEDEKEIRRQSEEERKAYSKSPLGKITIAFTVICSVIMFVAFRFKFIIAGPISLIQTGLFSVSWLMGTQIIKERKKSLHIVLALAGFILIIPFIFWGSYRMPDKLEWPTIGLATNIPQPTAKYGIIKNNDDTHFRAILKKVSHEDYSQYVEKCKELGYTIDIQSDRYGFNAFNADGYELEIDPSYYSDEISIELKAPLEFKEYTWPRSDIAKLIPQPKSIIGKINRENDKGFSIYVADTTLGEFVEYVDSCADAGFTIDYSKGDTYYHADNSDGYHINITYKGNNKMYLELSAPQNVQ